MDIKTVDSVERDARPEEVEEEESPNGLPVDIRQRLEQIWQKAYAAETQEDLIDFYAHWAATYDEDHAAIGYFGHMAACEIFSKHLPPSDEIRVLDAGAGTGAGGEVLKERGYRHLTAIDLSQDMLDVARGKGLYEELCQADLGQPLDLFRDDHFDGVILVGVFSYGQAPAHALEEIVRLVKPGGVIAFTMRTDFFDSDAMGVRSQIAELEGQGAWRCVEVSEAMQYLPKKDPKALFKVWCYQVLESKRQQPSDEFRAALRAAMTSQDTVKRLDHAFIWDRPATRLYNAYIDTEGYHLNDCEEEILHQQTGQLLADHSLAVELGCGSATKIRIILDAALERNSERTLLYVPVDLSQEALDATSQEVREGYGDQVVVWPQQGHFDEVLKQVPPEEPKTLFFFGSSIGNIESIEDTIAFLSRIRRRMTDRDRFVIGFDLQKDREVFDRAYNGGKENHSFFLHMIRRINSLFGADFDLGAFRLGSTYDEEPSYHGMKTRAMNLKLVLTKAQRVNIPALDLIVELDAGTAIQVGTSRKFRCDDIHLLAAEAGFHLRTLWLDSRHYFALAELLPRKTSSESTA